MTDLEHKVAVAAIAADKSRNLIGLESAISKAIGASGKGVKATLANLVKEFVLKICATPARNVASGEQRFGAGLIWYEKGEMWKEPSKA
jgi:hypothetical protein